MAETVAQMFAETAAASGANPFLILPPSAATGDAVWQITYAEAAEAIAALRARYQAAGYGHGHRVALLLESRPEFFLHYLALNGLGVGMVPINPDYRRDEMAYVLEHSEAELAVTLPHRLAGLAEAAAACARPPPIVDALALPDALPSPATPARSDAPGLETECALLYTSGTTGRPKGCMLSNLYFLTSGRTYLGLGGLIDFRYGQERFYNPLPLYHMNHLALLATASMLTANALVLTERFSPMRWWPEVSATGATVIHYLGVVAPMLLNNPPGPADRAHKVRLGVGAGIEPQLHKPFEDRFGFPMVEVWGMTETGRILGDCHEPRMIDTRAFGRPAPAGLEARVVDGNDHDVAVGADGELVIRHSAATPRLGFFSGYLKNEEATADAWRNGWFHTGDVVRQDETGMIFFVDRKKHIIRRAGENIAAAEVEAVLQAHEAVAQVAVLPVADELREEEVLACVVPMAGATAGPALAEALFEHCNARLAYFKTPGWVLFLDKLPTTGTQKVQKTQIFPAGEDPRKRQGIVDLRGRKRRG